MILDIRLPRVLTHHRAFSACVALSLGIGISAAAAVIAVVDSMKFAPLPFANAPRLEQVYYTLPSDSALRRWSVPPEVARAIKTGGSPVADVAVYSIESMRIRDRERTVDQIGVRVSPNFATVLGPRMLLGRAFGPADASVPSVILGYSYWTTTLGSDSSIVGRTIDVSGVSAVVTGVAAREWQFPNAYDVWMSDPSIETARDRNVQTLVLLDHPTNDRDRAAIATRATAAYYAAKTLRGSSRARVSLASAPLREYMTTGMKTVILILTIIATFVGLLAAVNFAVLVLARGIKRRGEIGVRAALGASLGRLVREIVGECLVLCALSGAAAAFLAPTFIAIVRSSFEQVLPAWLLIETSWRTVGASVALALVIGIVFGVGPALDIARPALVGFLRGAAVTSSDDSRLTRARSRLVALQVALATTVLVSLSAVLGKSLLMTRPDTGFAHESVAIGLAKDSTGTLGVMRGQPLLDGVRQTPGVAAAALVGYRYVSSLKVFLDDEPHPDDAPMRLVSVNHTSPGFLTVMRPRLVTGRLPTLDEETSGAPVIVVTRGLAEELFEGRQIVGRRLQVPSYPNQPLTVIGVIEQTQVHPYSGMDMSTIFVSANVRGARSATAAQLTELWVRSNGPITSAIRAIQLQATQHRFGFAEVLDLRSVPAMLDRDARTFSGLLRFVIGVFAMALGLAALGIYGLVAYTAEMRARELAIREAVGATRVHVSGLVLRSAMIQGAAGVSGGAILATGVIGWLNRSNLHLEAIASTTLLSVVLVGLTILLSSIGPLHSTWRRDISQVLRV